VTKAEPWATDTDQARQLRAQMVAMLVQGGDITDERWQHAFTVVPRHALVPRYYRCDNYQEIDGTKADHYATWLPTIYSDETLVTQKTSRTVTSSGTMPGLVAVMLDGLDVRDGQRVLQVGTGTGYTAALLCERLGSHHVTTIDIDPGLVDAARARLAASGYTPTVVAADGAEGFRPNAPYDRILATCAVDRIPNAWLAQVVSGSRIVAPLAKGLIALRIHQNGDASGRFRPTAGYFMPLRHSLDADEIAKPPTISGEGARRPTPLGPRDTFYQQDVRFLLSVTLPDVSVGQHGPSLDDLIIRDRGGSWARLDRTQDGSQIVTEGGSRNLWLEVEHLYQQWHGWHRPSRERFGLSVTTERQWIWLDDPHGQHHWELTD
jgi:protein-L-isoaspartate(D-aspartate) O-methyltransferase